MGTVPPRLKLDDRTVPVSMFNFGMSKVLHGRVCLYAFSVWLKPAPEIASQVDPGGPPVYGWMAKEALAAE